LTGTGLNPRETSKQGVKYQLVRFLFRASHPRRRGCCLTAQSRQQPDRSNSLVTPDFGFYSVPIPTATRDSPRVSGWLHHPGCCCRDAEGGTSMGLRDATL
jgi:hypothetical protein